MLGADLVVESSSAIPDSWSSRAQASGLRTVRSWQFPSMVGGDTGLMLASLKGVESGYPLRGTLRTVTVLGGPELTTTTAPEIGQVWVDPQILAQTGLKIGQTLKVGDLALTIARASRQHCLKISCKVFMRANDPRHPAIDRPPRLRDLRSPVVAHSLWE